MSHGPRHASLFPSRDEPGGFDAERLRWLVRMRWIAMLGIVVITVLGALGAYRGLAWRVSGTVAVLGMLYNVFRWWMDRRTSAPLGPRPSVASQPRAAVVEALVDMLLLTGVLWSAGGLASPFVSFYVFHVAIVGILGGPRATMLALTAAVGCVAALACTNLFPVLAVGVWDPVPPLDVLTTVAASVMTVASAAYMVTHATEVLRSREVALAEALGQEGKLVLAERLVSLGRVAQGVAHELNTPLATIRTLASDMRAALKAAEGSGDGMKPLVRDVDESAALIHEETKRLGRITQSLLAGGDLLQARIDGNVPVGAVAARARMLVFAGADPKVQVEITPSLDRITAAADPDRLMQVLVNLLQNARDATKDVPSPAIRVDGVRGQDYVEISVEDNGSGLTADAAARLFEPFFTTKAKGTGLGLYTSYMMVRRMDGDLSLSPLASGGARAIVRLPLSPEGGRAGTP